MGATAEIQANRIPSSSSAEPPLRGVHITETGPSMFR